MTRALLASDDEAWASRSASENDVQKKPRSEMSAAFLQGLTEPHDGFCNVFSLKRSALHSA
jgi:hypothetical protein